MWVLCILHVLKKRVAKALSRVLYLSVILSLPAMRLAYIVLIPTSLALLLIISLSVFYVTWTNDATTTTSTLPPKTSTSTEVRPHFSRF